MNVGFNPRVFLFERLFRLLDGVLLEGVESSQRQAAAAELHKKEADHNMFLASFDLLVAVDPTVGANMARGPWAAYATGSLSSTYA